MHFFSLPTKDILNSDTQNRLRMSFRGGQSPTHPFGGLSCPFGAIHLLGISWYTVRILVQSQEIATLRSQ